MEGSVYSSSRPQDLENKPELQALCPGGGKSQELVLWHCTASRASGMCARPTTGGMQESAKCGGTTTFKHCSWSGDQHLQQGRKEEEEELEEEEEIRKKKRQGPAQPREEMASVGRL